MKKTSLLTYVRFICSLVKPPHVIASQKIIKADNQILHLTVLFADTAKALLPSLLRAQAGLYPFISPSAILRKNCSLDLKFIKSLKDNKTHQSITVV